MAYIKNKITLRLYFAFITGLVFAVFSSSLTGLKLVHFAPFLILLFYQKDFISSLWISALCGLIVDIFSSNSFGLFALCYTTGSFFLYKEKRFFNDKAISLSVFTSIYSLIFSLFTPLLFFIFDKKINLSIKWLLTDVIIMPLFDGLYAFMFFALPILLIKQVKKINFKTLWITYKKIIFQK